MRPRAAAAGAGEIDLVGDASRSLSPRAASSGGGGAASAALASHQPQRRGRRRARAPACAGCPRARSTLAASRMPAVSDDDHRIAAEVEPHLDHVARRAGLLRDDRRLAPGERVEEARLAHVGRAREHDAEALAQDLAAVAVVEVRERLPPAAVRQSRAPSTKASLATSASSEKSMTASTRAVARISSRPPALVELGQARRPSGAAPGAAAPRSRRR